MLSMNAKNDTQDTRDPPRYRSVSGGSGTWRNMSGPSLPGRSPWPMILPEIGVLRFVAAVALRKMMLAVNRLRSVSSVSPSVSRVESAEICRAGG